MKEKMYILTSLKNAILSRIKKSPKHLHNKRDFLEKTLSYFVLKSLDQLQAISGYHVSTFWVQGALYYQHVLAGGLEIQANSL